MGAAEATTCGGSVLGELPPNRVTLLLSAVSRTALHLPFMGVVVVQWLSCV